MNTLSNERLEEKLKACEQYHFGHQAPINVKELRDVLQELLALRKEREAADDSTLADSHTSWLNRNFPRNTFSDEEWHEMSLYTWLAWRDSVRYTQPAQPVAVPDVKPSFKAMMLALDAFYAGEDVPEVAMLAAYKILRDDCRAAMTAQPTKADNVIGQYQGADGAMHDIVTLSRTASGQSQLLSSKPQKPVAWISDSGKSLILDSEIEPCFKFNGWKPLGYQSSAEPGKTEPVSTAYKFPYGWIKCSERMPEEGGRYWCYVEEINSLGRSHYQWNCSWNGEEWGGEALNGRVTHWMPLPAAPGKEGDTNGILA